MKLILMRHGEASFAAPSDQQRPITRLGNEQNCLMGHYLTAQIASLDLVLVSPYLRAQQTWQQIEPLLPTATSVITLEEITPMSDPALSHDIIQAHMEVIGARTTLVVAHMPLLGYLLAEFIPGQGVQHFDTSAMAQIKLGAQAELIEIKSPAELAIA